MFSCICFIDNHHCVYTAKDVYVCESSSSVCFCYLRAASWYICLSGRFGPCVCQDVTSFGSSLSRCFIFCQVTLLSSVCVCVCVCLGVWVLVYVRMLRRQPVNMFHISSGDPFVLCVCMCVCVSGHLGPRVCQDTSSFGNSLSRCSIFLQVTLLSSVCVRVCVSGRSGPCVCQDAPSFGNSLSRCSIFCQVTLLSSVCVRVCICVCVWAFGSLCMSGCSILRQQPVKMFHLSSGDPFVLCVCTCVYMCVCLGVWVLVYVRMLHPSATACQDVPSFVR